MTLVDIVVIFPAAELDQGSNGFAAAPRGASPERYSRAKGTVVEHPLFVGAGLQFFPVHEISQAADSRWRGGSTTAREIMQRMHNNDEQIVLICNAASLRCGEAIYFCRSEMVERVRCAKSNR